MEKLLFRLQMVTFNAFIAFFHVFEILFGHFQFLVFATNTDTDEIFAFAIHFQMSNAFLFLKLFIQIHHFVD